MKYQHFITEGQTYIFRPNNILKYFVIILGILVAVGGYRMQLSSGRAVVIVLGLLLALIGFLRLGSRVTFDVHGKTVTSKTGFLFPEKIYHFGDFESFLVNKQTMGITLTAQGFLNFSVNNRIKRVVLSEYFFTARPFQKISAELFDIMGIPQE